MKFLLTLLRPEWKHVAAAVCAAGILHICVTLASPVLTASPAYAQLADALPLHKIKLLPQQTPDQQILPFMGPAARFAGCRFDARKGSVAVTATLLAPGWVLSIFTPEGDNIYSAVAPPGQPREISLKLVPSGDRFLGLQAEAVGSAFGTERSLTVAAEKGLVLIRAPDQGIPYADRNLAVLARATCVHRKT